MTLLYTMSAPSIHLPATCATYQDQVGSEGCPKSLVTTSTDYYLSEILIDHNTTTDCFAQSFFVLRPPFQSNV